MLWDKANWNFWEKAEFLIPKPIHQYKIHALSTQFRNKKKTSREINCILNLIAVLVLGKQKKVLVRAFYSWPAEKNAVILREFFINAVNCRKLPCHEICDFKGIYLERTNLTWLNRFPNWKHPNCHEHLPLQTKCPPTTIAILDYLWAP